MPNKMTLDEILNDLQAVESKILEYQKKYKLLSSYFYKLYQAGNLEESWDFQNWAGLYEIKLDREQEYDKMLEEVIETLPLTSMSVKDVISNLK